MSSGRNNPTHASRPRDAREASENPDPGTPHPCRDPPLLRRINAPMRPRRRPNPLASESGEHHRVHGRGTSPPHRRGGIRLPCRTAYFIHVASLPCGRHTELPVPSASRTGSPSAIAEPCHLVCGTDSSVAGTVADGRPADSRFPCKATSVRTDHGAPRGREGQATGV